METPTPDLETATNLQRLLSSRTTKHVPAAQQPRRCTKGKGPVIHQLGSGDTSFLVNLELGGSPPPCASIHSRFPPSLLQRTAVYPTDASATIPAGICAPNKTLRASFLGRVTLSKHDRLTEGNSGAPSDSG